MTKPGVLALKSLPVAALSALLLAGSASAASFADGAAAEQRADYAAALQIFREGAVKDDPMSQFALAEMYRQGQGVRRDSRQALAWYRKAADHENPGAEYRLGLAYQSGQGVAKNAREASRWLARAAAHGNGDAAASLAAVSDVETGAPKDRFRAMMDRVFGAGRWRETSGYRTLAQEDELRKQGAGTVPVGERSRHSMGRPDAPGAYDVVVDGMAPQLAAVKLKRSGEPLARVVAEAAHGTQGPHLHVEPILTRVSASRPARVEPIEIDTPARLLAIASKPASAEN
jgi:hypothetical protein